MALPTLTDAKNFLRLDLLITAEDSLVTLFLTRALALIEQELGYAITAVSRTHVDYEERDNYGQRPRLALPGPFKTASPTPRVSDADENAVDSSDYIADARGMRILAAEGVQFSRRPYTIVATIGLSAHPDYSAKLEAVVSIAILDLVAHFYLNRNPALSSEQDEGGASKVVQLGRIPTAVMDTINELPGRMGGMVLS